MACLHSQGHGQSKEVKACRRAHQDHLERVIYDISRQIAIVLANGARAKKRRRTA